MLFKYNSITNITNVYNQIVNENYSHDLFKNLTYTLNKTEVLEELQSKYNNSK